MANQFDVFYLGNFASIDPTEGNSRSENAASLLNTSFGGAEAPLYNNVKTLSPGATGYGNTVPNAYATNNDAEVEDNPTTDDTFRIDGGVDQTFDATASYGATITYANGQPPVDVVAIVFQDTNGNLYLAPAQGSSAYQDALQAGPIESITFNTVSTDTADMAGSRVDGDYVTPDGWFDGTAVGDNLAVGSMDAQADRIDDNDNAINGGAGNDTIASGAGADTVLGGAGDDSIDGGSGSDVIYGDSAIGTATSFSWADQGIADNASVSDGVTGITGSGDIQVKTTFVQEGNFVSASMESSDALFDYNDLSDSSSISMYGGASGADTNTATMQIEFSALNNSVSDEVSKVTFGIFDVDLASGYEDELFIRAYDANGNLIHVDLTAGNPDTVSVDDATGRAIAIGAGRGLTSSKTGFLQVEVAGPVARIEIDYNNPNPGDSRQGIRVGDLKLSTLSTNQTGNDTLVGNAGDDSIFGDGGDDSILGGDGDDSLIGGTGSDTILGGAGNDFMSGGDDSDVFVVEDGFGTDTIAGGEGGVDSDLITFNALTSGVTLTYSGPESGMATAGVNSVDFTKIEKLVLTDYADFVDATLFGVSLETGAGDDTINVGTGVYDINAGSGDDRVIRNTATNVTEAGSVLDGGAGTDTYVAGGALGGNTINLETEKLEFQGNDRGDIRNFENVKLDNIAASVVGDSGDNKITAIGDYDNNLTGGGGNDLIDAGGGNDTVSGGTGNDTLLGGAGNDTLDGGAGDDLLTGNDGDDVFIYSGGNDTITDLNFGSSGPLDDGITNNNDFIDLSGYYNKIFDLRADYADNNVLDQSNFSTVDYTGKSQFGTGSLRFAGMSASDFSYDNTGVVCFGAGTAIRTPQGDVLIEDLRVGDLVNTMDNGPQRIKWVNQRSYTFANLRHHEHLYPILIRRGTFGAERDLLVSQQHGILTGRTGDTFARAKHLVGHTNGVRFARGKKSVTYIHLMFESHEVIFAENVASESFYPGPMALDQMTPQDRLAFSKVLPGLSLGFGKVTHEHVSNVYGATARKFIGRKFLITNVSKSKRTHGTPASRHVNHTQVVGCRRQDNLFIAKSTA